MNATLLVVEDNPESLQLLSDILTREGYRVLPAPNARTASELAHAHLPDLILLDINLPEITGYDLCKAFKDEEALSHIPVIFVSALVQTFDKVKGFQVGGVDYITKPYNMEEILARVSLHLRLQQQRRELEELRHKDQQYVEKLTDFIESLMGTANHDLRNPIMSINLSLSVLSRYGRIDDERGQSLLKRVQDEAASMANLVNELLDVAQIEAFRENNS